MPNVTLDQIEVPEPQEVIRDLERFVPIAYGGVEAGCVLARGFFDARHEEYEPFLFSDIVRYGAKKHLERHRLKAELEIADLANNGLLVGYNGYPLRLRKAYRGSVGVPGSLAMEQFHAQTLRLFPRTDKPNLFILWDVFRPSYALKPDLWVACPRRNTARFPNTADLHWLWKLPNVALLPGQPIKADGSDDFEDLPMRVPIEGTGTEER